MGKQNKKKSLQEFHFVDMNDPDRYKKLKVARACDFCRKRKSKCDVGIPNSGTCTNCKKSNHVCVFTPVSASSTSNSMIILKQQKKMFPANSNSQSSSDTSTPPLTTAPTTINSTQTTPETSNGMTSYFNQTNINSMYHIQGSIFSLDQRGLCNYEKHNTCIYNHTPITSSMNELPTFTEQMQKELFDIYFNHVHPFFPILDRFHVLNPNSSIPSSMKYLIMAIALHFAPQYHDNQQMASTFYHHATLQLDHTPCLASVRILFLLYKFQEIITPVGSPMSVVAVNYLKELQSMLNQLTRTTDIFDEFLCRASWIMFITVTTISPADERWLHLLDNCETPTCLPSLTETEQYDKTELNIICNLIHLASISHLFSTTIRTMSSQNTLFINQNDHTDYSNLYERLNSWKSKLPNHILLALNAEPPNLYSAQNSHNNSSDTSRSNSFISYLCLIHDIMDLIMDLFQSKTSQISRKSTRIFYRAHSLTLGDVQGSSNSRMASIHGSRLICFGLTLAIQSFVYSIEQTNCQLEDMKKFNSNCSLAFQILDDFPLSPQLYMTIQSLRNQLKAKEQLNTIVNSDIDQQSSSNNSSSYSTPNVTFLRSSSQDHVYYQQNQFGNQSNDDDRWQNYHNNYQEGWNQFGDNNQYYYQHQSMDLPRTPPAFGDDSLSTPPFEPLTPPANLHLDSDFRTYSATISYGMFVAIESFPAPPSLRLPTIQSSKSCKNHMLS